MKSKCSEYEKPIESNFESCHKLKFPNPYIFATAIANDDIVSILHNEVIVHRVMMYANPLVILQAYSRAYCIFVYYKLILA